MKKILALILALVMVFALVACGTTAAPAATEEPKTEEPAATEAPVEEPTEAPAEPTEAPAEEPATVNADDIEDTMTSADGKYEVVSVSIVVVRLRHGRRIRRAACAAVVAVDAAHSVIQGRKCFFHTGVIVFIREIRLQVLL